MEKRNSTMRLGLGKIGRATALLAEATQKKCTASATSARELHDLAQKLEGYGKDKAFIHYRKMEALRVGGHDLHKPLNEFLGAWKKEAAEGKAVGEALGKFFLALKGEATEGKAAEL